MKFDMTRPYSARELFELAPGTRKGGKPSFMNLRALRRPGRPISMESLTGAGIYGLFLHGKLYYIGIFAGASENTLTGTVLVRWEKHLTYQSLRSPEVCFSRKNIEEILDAAPNGPFDAIAAEVGGRSIDRNSLNPDDNPLLQRHGGSCTYAKARFAALNWDVFGPGNEELMVDAVTFVFARLKPELLSNAQPMTKAHRKWIKSKWLGRCEATMIAKLKPVCNAQTRPGDEKYGTLADFTRELESAAEAPFPEFVPIGGLAECGGSVPVVGSGEADASHILELEGTGDHESGELDPREARFRGSLTQKCEAFVDELLQLLPLGIEMNFTGIPDLRLHQEPGHHVLMTLSKTNRDGLMPAKIKANPALAHTLGFADAIWDGEQEWATFKVDPVRHQPSAILTLSGAAMERRLR
jgi:hypothetical protein